MVVCVHIAWLCLKVDETDCSFNMTTREPLSCCLFLCVCACVCMRACVCVCSPMFKTSTRNVNTLLNVRQWLFYGLSISGSVESVCGLCPTPFDGDC